MSNALWKGGFIHLLEKNIDLQQTPQPDISRNFSLLLNTMHVKGQVYIMILALLTFSLLMTAQEAFVDSIDQDQTARNVQSDLDLLRPHIQCRL